MLPHRWVELHRSPLWHTARSFSNNRMQGLAVPLQNRKQVMAKINEFTK